MGVSDFGLIHLSSATPDFLGFWPKDSERDRLHVKGSAEEYGMLIDISLEDRYLKAIKSSWILQNWTEESPSRQIEKVHGITPGDLRHRIDLMDWLLYSSKELIRVDNAFSSEHQEMVQALISRLDTLRTRIRHGCLEDILELIRLPNIGRVRARSLMNFGVRNPADLLALSPAKITALKAKRGWGEKIVERMMNEVHRITGRKRGVSPKQRDDDEVLPGERVD
jgi:helicase